MAENDVDKWELLKKIERVEKATTANFKDVRDELTGVREVLNNGIVSATIKNTEAINDLVDRFNELESQISNEDAKKEGKISMLKLIIAVASGVGTGVITVLSILRYLGYL